MAVIATGSFAHIELSPNPLRVLPLRDKADIYRIVNIIAAIKNPGPIGRRIEPGAQRRHRAIVQIRRAQPDAVEKGGDVTARLDFDESFSLDAKTLHHLVGIDCRLLAPSR